MKTRVTVNVEGGPLVEWEGQVRSQDEMTGLLLRIWDKMWKPGRGVRHSIVVVKIDIEKRGKWSTTYTETSGTRDMAEKIQGAGYSAWWYMRKDNLDEAETGEGRDVEVQYPRL